MDFRARFGHLGVFSARPSPAIEAYVASVERQIVRLNTNTPPSTGDWFKVEEDCVKVSLRFRGRILPLFEGSNLMKVPSREVAVAFLQATIDTAREGLFNDVFQQVIDTKNPRDSSGKYEPERAKTPEELAEIKAMVMRQYQALKDRQPT